MGGGGERRGRCDERGRGGELYIYMMFVGLSDSIDFSIIAIVKLLSR